MPDASYQWSSAFRIVPLGSFTSAYPLRLRHRPGPYSFRRRGSSRMELPAANASTPAISPQTSKNTLPAFYHLLEREHYGVGLRRCSGTVRTAGAGGEGGFGPPVELWTLRRFSRRWTAAPAGAVKHRRIPGHNFLYPCRRLMSRRAVRLRQLLCQNRSECVPVRTRCRSSSSIL